MAEAEQASQNRTNQLDKQWQGRLEQAQGDWQAKLSQGQVQWAQDRAAAELAWRDAKADAEQQWKQQLDSLQHTHRLMSGRTASYCFDRCLATQAISVCHLAKMNVAWLQTHSNHITRNLRLMRSQYTGIWTSRGPLQWPCLAT